MTSPKTQVVLELEDVEEEEELVGLEGGHAPKQEVDGAPQGEEEESPPRSKEPALK